MRDPDIAPLSPSAASAEEQRMPRRSFLVRSTLVGLMAATASVATAQGPTVNNPPNTKEFGIDAGAVFGLGDESSVQITLPAARMRVGFFLNNDSRWSIEPAVGLSYNKVEGADGVLVYNLEVGALYHLRPPSAVTAVTPASVMYVRPFVGVVGFTGDDSDSEFSVGAGFGVKIPWQSALAWRLEANTGYGFDNEAFRIGAFAGLSLFTR
jgi:hypothetical protein